MARLFAAPIDFCVWALEYDGLHVPPFDRHPDGDASLRAEGLTPDMWREWVAAVDRQLALCDQPWEQVRGGPQQSDEERHRILREASLAQKSVLEQYDPYACVAGLASLRETLETLRIGYGADRSPRNQGERGSRGTRKAQLEGPDRQRLQDVLAPHHGPHGEPVIVRLVSYPGPTVYTIQPATIVVGSRRWTDIDLPDQVRVGLEILQL